MNQMNQFPNLFLMRPRRREVTAGVHLVHCEGGVKQGCLRQWRQIKWEEIL
jgi:hypothetical protein